MLLKHKKLLYLLTVMAFLAMTSCVQTPTKPSSECFDSKKIPRIPNQACAVTPPKLRGHYEGSCKNGKAHGHGLAIGINVYEGNFVNGLPHGQGTLTWLDKKCFTGQFKKGVAQIPHVGCYVADVRLRGSYKGECRKGKAYGRGKAVGIDTYQGGFINGIQNGRGTYVWANGDRYVGQFKEGEAYGRGMMIYADGTKENVNN